MIRVFVAIFCLLISGSIFPQDSSLNKSKNNQVLKEPGYLYYSITDKSGNVNTTKIDMMEVVDVFVEFKDDPLFVQMNKNPLMKINAQAYRQTADRFMNDVTAMTKRLSYGGVQKAAPLTVKKSFYKLINGVCIEVPKILIGTISSLDYVKKVYKNSTYEIIEDYTVSDNPAVNYSAADSAGKGIIIGIIDTGIDYMHPALGGGIGPAFKVIGGYDIIDEDNDPMDFDGHGTHVAGIAAGNSDKLKGVAPEARLMAFKVFSQTKSAAMDIVIEAVERAVDPNNDGNSDDKVDVVNMSLGAYGGNPEDAVSIAVNNAVKLGTVFCIAVGNAGQYKMIGSPGNAELAIGVGAKDTTDQTVYFSSKGPTNKTYSIKPDIIAPGTRIFSSLPGNEYGEGSGTSMASPFVAGMCAAIKSAHKNWTPAEIKSAIMNNAAFMDEPVMSQGSGIVNLQKALNTGTMVFPPSLSYGYCNTDVENWSITDTLVIKNLSTVTKNYKVSLPAYSNYFNISPVLSSAGPGDSAIVLITLNVNNSSNPYVDNFTSYNGIVNISCEDELLHIPWAFVKYPRLRINFDKPYPNILVLSTKNMIFSDMMEWDQEFLNAETLLPNDTYTIYSIFSELSADSSKTIRTSLVAEEDFVFSNSAEIGISSEGAKNYLNFNAADINGNKLSEQQSWLGSIVIKVPRKYPLTSIRLSALTGEEIKVSDFSDQYTFYAGEFHQDLMSEKRVTITSDGIYKGLTSSLNLVNDPAEYRRYNINLQLSPFKVKPNFCFGGTVVYSDDDYKSYSTYFNNYVEVTDHNWSGTLYITPPADSQLFFSSLVQTDISRSNYYDTWLETGFFNMRNDSLGVYSYYGNNDLYVPENASLSFGNGLTTPTLNLYTYNNSNLYAEYYGVGQFGEIRNSDVLKSEFSIYDNNNNLIKSGTLLDIIDANTRISEQGKYRFEIKNRNYVVVNTRGEFNYKGTFYRNEYNSFNNPPALSFLNILNSANTPVSLLKKNEKASLVFKIRNTSISTASAIAYIRETGEKEWKTLQLKNLTTGYEPELLADLSSYTNSDSSSLDLRIILANDDLSAEYIWQPAVGIGSFSGTLDTSGEILIPAAFKLYNNYPNPFNNSTVIRYDLPTEAKVKLEIFNIIGERIATLYDGAQSAGTHEALLNADNYASGVYIYRLTAEGKSFFQKSSKMVLLK